MTNKNDINEEIEKIIIELRRRRIEYINQCKKEDIERIKMLTFNKNIFYNK